jgi:septum formation protein
MQRQIILASSSKYKQELLGYLGLKFKAIDSGYEENLNLKMSAKKLAIFLALGKARAVAKKYANAIVIGADTLAEYKGKVFGKPQTAENAKKFLKLFSGKTHNVVTGLAIIDTKTQKIWTQALVTKVKFRKIYKDEIDSYVQTGEPLDKAGGYTIRRRGAMFIESIEGEYTTVVGLPLCALSVALRKFGLKFK